MSEPVRLGEVISEVVADLNRECSLCGIAPTPSIEVRDGLCSACAAGEPREGWTYRCDECGTLILDDGEMFCAECARDDDVSADLADLGISRYHIPGTMYLEVDEGRSRLVFLPSASYAGYFGQSAEWVGGPDLGDAEAWDGPVWNGVRDALSRRIEWEE